MPVTQRSKGMRHIEFYFAMDKLSFKNRPCCRRCQDVLILKADCAIGPLVSKHRHSLVGEGEQYMLKPHVDAKNDFCRPGRRICLPINRYPFAFISRRLYEMSKGVCDFLFFLFFVMLTWGREERGKWHFLGWIQMLSQFPSQAPS